MTDDRLIWIYLVAMGIGLIFSVIGAFGYGCYTDRHGGPLSRSEERRPVGRLLIVVADLAAIFTLIPFLILFVMFLAGVL